MIHLIIALDEGTDVGNDLLIRPDHEAWHVTDADGRGVGVGYQAELGVTDVNGLGAATTYIRLIEESAASDYDDDPDGNRAIDNRTTVGPAGAGEITAATGR